MRSFLSHYAYLPLCVTLLAMLAPSRGQADDIYWDVAGDGSWNVATNWNPQQEPANGDDVYLTSSDATDTTVYYATSYPMAVFNSLTIDATGSGSMTLDQVTDPLSANELRVGETTSGEGSYNLSGSGSLSTHEEYIGYSGTGSFTQSGGTNEVQDLLLAYQSGSEGSYELSGTGSLSAGWEDIGFFGTGSFTHSGGTNQVDALYLGSGPSGQGSYELSGTGSLFADREHIGDSSTGSFTQSGGTNAVTTDFYLGYWSDGQGSYNLQAGSLSADTEYIGDSGIGSFIQSGGTNEVTHKLFLGSNSGGQGSYDLQAGSVSADQEIIGDSGIGSFTQSSGTNEVTDSLFVGGLPTTHGSYDLSGTGSLSADTEYIGDSGTGSFTQSGGTNAVTYNLYLGLSSGSQGSYTLSGGSLDVGGDILLGFWSGSEGTYTLSGGSLNVGGNISSGDGMSTLAIDGGTLTLGGGTSGSIDVDDFRVGDAPGSDGAFTLNSGQSLSADNQYIGYAGTGSFTQSGGTNAVTYNLYVGLNSGSQGSYTLSGGSVDVGEDIILGETGHLVGGEGDTFKVGRDLLSSSQASVLWDTVKADLMFQGESAHTLEYTGADLGQSYGGYDDNYAWGLLSLALGESLTLQDGDAVSGGAIYVGVLELLGGLEQIASIVGNGLNLYYDPTQAGNDYLGGQTFALAGGGSIAPVPEPGTGGLVALGLLALGLRGRAQRRR